MILLLLAVLLIPTICLAEYEKNENDNAYKKVIVEEKEYTKDEVIIELTERLNLFNERIESLDAQKAIIVANKAKVEQELEALK